MDGCAYLMTVFHMIRMETVFATEQISFSILGGDALIVEIADGEHWMASMPAYNCTRCVCHVVICVL